MIGLRPEEAAREEQIRRARASRTQAAAFRKAIGCSLRRTPGPLPTAERKAFERIVHESELSPRELLDELFHALCDQLQPSAPEAASWFAAPKVDRGDHYGAVDESTAVDSGTFPESPSISSSNAKCAIIHENDPGATPIARGPARNEKGSERS